MSAAVLIVYHELVEGGLSVDVANMAGALTDLGTDVHVATIDRPGVMRMSASVQLHCVSPLISSPRFRRFGPAAGVTSLARHVDASIVHVYSWLPVAFHVSAMRAARLDGRRLVWTPMMHPARSRLWASYPAHVRVGMRTFDRGAFRIARHVDAIFASTVDEAEMFLAAGARRVELVPPAVAGVERTPAADPGGATVLVVAGRDEPRKGLAFALDAYRALHRSTPSARLVIVGDVEQRQIDGVEIVGRLTDAALEEAFAMATVVFVPSSYEAFSRVVIEAWAHARAVVATDGVGLASEIEAIDGGRIVRYGDVHEAAGALAELIDDHELARRMGQRGRAAVEDRYTLPDVTRRAAAIYSELESAGSSRRIEEPVA